MPDLTQPAGSLLIESDAWMPEVAYVQQGDKVLFLRGDNTLNESVDTDSVQIVESIDDLELIERDGHKSVKDGKWVVEGPYQRSDVENANKRKYPRSIWERIIGDPNSKFMKNVTEGGVIGHLEHPKDGRTDGNMGGVFHRDFKLKPDGVVWGRSELLDTPEGKRLQEYTSKGVRWGFSSRGRGGVDSSGSVGPDFELETFDAVMRPSTTGAYPKQIDGKGKVNANKSTDESSVSKGLALIEMMKTAAGAAKRSGEAQVVVATEGNGSALAVMSKELYESSDTHKQAFPKVLHDTSADAPAAPDPALTESMENQVQAIIEEASTDEMNLEEADSLLQQMMKLIQGVNTLDKAKKIARDKAHLLRDALTKKVSEVSRKISKPTTLTESANARPDDKRKDDAFRRVVAALNTRIEQAVESAESLRAEVDIQRTRAEEAEALAENEQTLREQAVERAVNVGLELDEARSQLETATGYIQDLSRTEVRNPVMARVQESIEKHPQIEQHRVLLERADDVEQVDALVKSLTVGQLNERSSVTRRFGIRPQLPSGRLVSEPLPDRRPKSPDGSGDYDVPQGAKIAAQVVAKMART